MEKSSIVFSRDRYKGDRDKMFQAIAKQLALLMENEYVCKVYDDDIDIIVIEFDRDERICRYGGDELIWLSQDEIEALEDIRRNKNEEK